MIGRYLFHVDDYLGEKAAIEDLARKHGFPSSEVAVNAADDLTTGNIYLTVTGTSAEAGDDGQVGRGNRVNGLITPCRPMSLEAAAGKEEPGDSRRENLLRLGAGYCEQARVRGARSSQGAMPDSEQNWDASGQPCDAAGQPCDLGRRSDGSSDDTHRGDHCGSARIQQSSIKTIS
jgi:hypothetical protein